MDARAEGSHPIRSRAIALGLALILSLIVLAAALVNDCSSVGGMGSSAVRCDCSGMEWVLYDRTEADGPMKSVCLGIVRSTECFQYLDGPRVDCDR